jgi:hypothetical protein
VTISERAAGRGFVLANEGLGFLAILTADVGADTAAARAGRAGFLPAVGSLSLR